MITLQGLALFNLYGSILLAAMCGWAVMSKQVDDGILMKLGLSIVSLGHIGSASLLFNGIFVEDTIGLMRAQSFVRVGCILVGIGYVLRQTQGGRMASARLRSFFGSFLAKAHWR